MIVPKISIIMNCFNGERYLKEAIDSIYAQTFADWEIIFWDNASTDRSREIAEGYDSRLRYFCSEKNVSLGAARRLAVGKATGDWIGFLDTDDLWHPHKLERQLTALEGTEHVLCYAGVQEINPDGSVIRELTPKYPTGHMLENQLNQFDINMVTPLIRRQALLEHGLNFDESVQVSEEYNLFIRLASKGSFCTIAEPLGVWRISPGSLTDQKMDRWAAERFYTLAQLKQENPGIENRYPRAFKQAEARGIYYKVRYLVANGEKGEAGRFLWSIASVHPVYLALLPCLFIPGAWNFAHKNNIKKRVAVLLGFSKQP